MSTVEHPLQALDKYLPPNTFLPVAAYLQKYKVHLTVSRERKTILGNYRNAYNNHSHRISVNGNLNTFSFLITLLHELAHLLTYEQYRNKVQPHGREWKTLYGQLLAQFIENKVFPADIESELLATLHNPGASSCSEEGLVRILRNYDPQKDNYNLIMIEAVAVSSLFKLKDGRVFKKGERLRKRYKCEEIATKRFFLFSPVYEVEVVN